MSKQISKNAVKDTVNTIRRILAIKQSLSGIDYLQILVKNIARELGVKYVFVGHAVDVKLSAIHTDVVWGNDAYLDNFEYELSSTPCNIVMTGDRVCIHDHNVSAEFPDDHLLEKMGIESYVGAPSISPNDELLGLLVILDDKPINDAEHMVSIVDFLAQRVSAEYERFNIERALQRQIEHRTAQLEAANNSLRKTVEELEIAKRELELKSRTDSLTHINNREWFTSLAQYQLKIAERNNYAMSLLFIDLDHFKQVNDTFGHQIGDIVLEKSAQRIKSCIRDIDILGRFGGEEFVLLSPYADTQSAIQLATRIKDALSGLPVHANNKDIYITCSIGIATTESHGHDLNELVKYADSALYQAKDGGRNAYRIDVEVV